MKTISYGLAAVILVGTMGEAEQQTNILPHGIAAEPALQALQSDIHTNQINVPFGAVQLDADLLKKLEKIIRETQPIKVGMTRADLLKVDMPDGGMSFPKWQMYRYRTCPYIHLAVEFEPVDNKKDLSSDNPSDIITKIGKPFLDFAYNN